MFMYTYSYKYYVCMYEMLAYVFVQNVCVHDVQSLCTYQHKIQEHNKAVLDKAHAAILS